MTETLVPLASALGFTLGCAAIHQLRRRAQRTTLVLAALIVVLIAALYVTLIVQGGPPQVDDVLVLDDFGSPAPKP